MRNPWKVATIGILAAGVTAVTSGLTTAYFLRADRPATSQTGQAPASLAGMRTFDRDRDLPEPKRPPIVRVARPAPTTPTVRPAAYEPPAPVASAPAPVASTPAPRPEPVVASAPAPGPEPVLASTSTTTAPADCATGGDRAWRIAKPGAVGTLVGAGVGAIGGAIADGGKGAGKGALWGGLAGAALGTGYGAYKTKQECGTIFGDSTPGTVSAPGVAQGSSAGTGALGSAGTEAPFAPRATATSSNGGGITVYDAR